MQQGDAVLTETLPWHSTKGVCGCLVQDGEKGKEVDITEPTHDYDRYYAEYDDDEEVGMLASPLGQ